MFLRQAYEAAHLAGGTLEHEVNVLPTDGSRHDERVAPPEAFHQRCKDRLPLLRSQANGLRHQQSPAVLVTVFVPTCRGR